MMIKNISFSVFKLERFSLKRYKYKNYHTIVQHLGFFAVAVAR